MSSLWDVPTRVDFVGWTPSSEVTSASAAQTNVLQFQLDPDIPLHSAALKRNGAL
jgi:hypothetical protein